MDIIEHDFGGGESEDDRAAEAPAKPREPEEKEVKVLMRQAKGIAMGWIGAPGDVQTFEKSGYCYLRVKIRGVWKEARATTWWDCLRAVQAELIKVGLLRVTAPAETEAEASYIGKPFSEDPFASALEYPKMPEGEARYCHTHGRLATHFYPEVHVLAGKPCCDPSLGGVMAPCDCEATEELQS